MTFVRLDVDNPSDTCQRPLFPFSALVYRCGGAIALSVLLGLGGCNLSDASAGDGDSSVTQSEGQSAEQANLSQQKKI